MKTIFALIVVLFVTNYSYSNNSTLNKTTKRLNPKKSCFIIEGEEVKLRRGISKSKTGKNSATKIITRYTGENSIADLNNDGTNEMVVILSQETGGSGTFYYAAVISSDNKRNKGSNAVFIGDRIKTKNIEINNEEIIINYLDRQENESMSALPTLKVSKVLQYQNNTLSEKTISDALVGKTWYWEQTIMNNGELTTPDKKDTFSITFGLDGKLSITTDCNNSSGPYKRDNNKLEFGLLMSTHMYCDGSQENDFIKSLTEVNSFFINENDQLVLMLKYDSGSIIFK